MYDSTDSVEKVQTHQDLPCDFFYQIKGETFIVVSLENLEKIDSEYFEDHAEVIAVWSFEEEGVEEVEDMSVVSFELLFVRLVFFKGLDPLRMLGVAGHLLQYLNLS